MKIKAHDFIPFSYQDILVLEQYAMLKKIDGQDPLQVVEAHNRPGMQGKAGEPFHKGTHRRLKFTFRKATPK